MHRLTLMLLLSAAAALGAGCSGGAGSMATGSIWKETAAAPATPAPSTAAAGGEPMARSTRVATTAARAQICGLPFDGAKLRASYLAYEAKRGLEGARLSAIERNYDATVSTVSGQRAAIADRCKAQQVTWTRDRSAEFSERFKDDIKAELGRYMAGTFDLADRAPRADGPMTPKGFWKDQDDG